MAIRLSGNKIKLLLLILLPVLLWQVDYQHADGAFTFCLFKNISGTNCYGCGTLRGLAAFLHLDFISLYRLNPVNLISVPLLACLYVKELADCFDRSGKQLA